VRKVSFILKTCPNIFSYQAVTCMKTTYKSVGMEMHVIKEQVELKQLAMFSLFVCHVIL